MADYGENVYHPPPKEWEVRYEKFSGKDFVACRKCGAAIVWTYGERHMKLHDEFHGDRYK